MLYCSKYLAFSNPTRKNFKTMRNIIIPRLTLCLSVKNWMSVRTGLSFIHLYQHIKNGIWQRLASSWPPRCTFSTTWHSRVLYSARMHSTVPWLGVHTRHTSYQVPHLASSLQRQLQYKYFQQTSANTAWYTCCQSTLLFLGNHHEKHWLGDHAIDQSYPKNRSLHIAWERNIHVNNGVPDWRFKVA